jgi:RHS repeat-associated protein
MNSAGTYYWTTLAGGQLSDTPGAGAGNEYIFFAGQRIAWVDSGGTVRYYWGDHLGTSRIITDDAGNVCYDADHYPFQGERPPYVNTCTPGYRFAGMKFDQESGNYYTLNRYYPPNLGRWMSPDPLAGDVTNPQSLNRYTYVLNNPTTLTDPTGLSAPWPLSAPGCSSWLPCYGSGGIPGGGGSGSAIFGNDIFDVISGVAGYSLVYTATGLGFTFDPSSAALSPFQYQFTGTLYGKSYNETFATWDAYADWRTGIAALPESQIYQAYMLACAFSVNGCSGANDTVKVTLGGFTYNVQLRGNPLDVSKAQEAGYKDPTNVFHSGNDSWYIGLGGLFGVEEGHVVNNPSGIEAHYDAFGPYNPLHLMDTVAGAFINVPLGSYTCSAVGGCRR